MKELPARKLAGSILMELMMRGVKFSSLLKEIILSENHETAMSTAIIALPFNNTVFHENFIL
jgi:hypothetical protein